MTKGPLFDPNRPEHIGGVPVLPGPSNVRHSVACVEGGRDRHHAECPGTFEVVCACGYSTWTPWGEAHAEEIAKVHLMKVGAPAQKVLR